ncbi:hypothetical protein BGZ94_009177 [Podila epigama]|nr:hypothetical protein BGZ94_009177 [Podila epigama]
MTGWESSDARLASFYRKPKSWSWPHAETFKATPATLSEAGFYFQPVEKGSDNVICFLCHKTMDGWNADNDPFKEHLDFSPRCGWAIVRSIPYVEDGGLPFHWDNEADLPRGERMTNARIQTFGDWWPHAKTPGWFGTVYRMANAGFIFAPTDDNPDNCQCPYCNIALDGWEAWDDPVHEHQRRTPNCPFFATRLEAPTKASMAKSRKRIETKETSVSKSTRTQRTRAADNTATTTTTTTTRSGRTAKSQATSKPVVVQTLTAVEVQTGKTRSTIGASVTSVQPTLPSTRSSRATKVATTSTPSTATAPITVEPTTPTTEPTTTLASTSTTTSTTRKRRLGKDTQKQRQTDIKGSLIRKGDKDEELEQQDKEDHSPDLEEPSEEKDAIIGRKRTRTVTKRVRITSRVPSSDVEDDDHVDLDNVQIKREKKDPLSASTRRPADAAEERNGPENEAVPVSAPDVEAGQVNKASRSRKTSAEETLQCQRVLEEEVPISQPEHDDEDVGHDKECDVVQDDQEQEDGYGHQGHDQLESKQHFTTEVTMAEPEPEPEPEPQPISEPKTEADITSESISQKNDVDNDKEQQGLPLYDSGANVDDRGRDHGNEEQPSTPPAKGPLEEGDYVPCTPVKDKPLSLPRFEEMMEIPMDPSTPVRTAVSKLDMDDWEEDERRESGHSTRTHMTSPLQSPSHWLQSGLSSSTPKIRKAPIHLGTTPKRRNRDFLGSMSPSMQSPLGRSKSRSSHVTASPFSDVASPCQKRKAKASLSPEAKQEQLIERLGNLMQDNANQEVMAVAEQAVKEQVKLLKRSQIREKKQAEALARSHQGQGGEHEQEQERQHDHEHDHGHDNEHEHEYGLEKDYVASSDKQDLEMQAVEIKEGGAGASRVPSAPGTPERRNFLKGHHVMRTPNGKSPGLLLLHGSDHKTISETPGNRMVATTPLPISQVISALGAASRRANPQESPVPFVRTPVRQADRTFRLEGLERASPLQFSARHKDHIHEADIDIVGDDDYVDDEEEDDIDGVGGGRVLWKGLSSKETSTSHQVVTRISGVKPFGQTSMSTPTSLSNSSRHGLIEMQDKHAREVKQRSRPGQSEQEYERDRERARLLSEAGMTEEEMHMTVEEFHKALVAKEIHALELAAEAWVQRFEEESQRVRMALLEGAENEW